MSMTFCSRSTLNNCFAVVLHIRQSLHCTVRHDDLHLHRQAHGSDDESEFLNNSVRLILSSDVCVLLVLPQLDAYAIIPFIVSAVCTFVYQNNGQEA